MTLYPTPNISNFTSMATYTNSVTNNLFWPVMGVMLAIISFFIAYRLSAGSPTSATASAAFIFFIYCLFGNLLGLVPGAYFTISIVLLAFSGLVLVMSKDRAL